MEKQETIETLPPAKFNVTDASLAELDREFAVLPDRNTEDGYSLIAEGIRKLTKHRTGVEKMRKEFVAGALEHQRKVNAEAKRVTERLVAIENRLRAEKKLVDDAKAILEAKLRHEEEDRKTACIQLIYSTIISTVDDVFGKTAKEIMAKIATLNAIDAEAPEYSLMGTLAADKKEGALSKLRVLWSQASASEEAAEKLAAANAKLAKEREEIEAERAKLAKEKADMEAEKRHLADEKKAADEAAAKIEPEMNADEAAVAAETEPEAIDEAPEVENEQEGAAGFMVPEVNCSEPGAPVVYYATPEEMIEGNKMTVKELINFLEKQPQEILVAYELYSEQCLLKEKDISVVELCHPRSDGWIQDRRPDMGTEEYLLFPGN